MSTTYDTIILGASIDGLTAAAYAARAGQRVIVLEKSDILGSASSTGEFAPGFQADVGLMSGRLAPEIVEDLRLADHGLEVIERASISSLLPGGKSFTLPSDRARAVESIRKFAPNDAARYGDFVKLLELAGDFLRTFYSMTPPQAHRPRSADLKKWATLAAKLTGAGKRETTELLRLLVMPVRDFLDEWFENNELKGLLASPAVRALGHGPFAGGTTFGLLHHLALGDAYWRATARGGTGAFSKALAAAAKSHGAELRLGVVAPQVVTVDGVATAVVLHGGERLEADKVVSSYDARYTFNQLVDPAELEPEFNRSVRHVRYNGCVARINLALSELPECTGLSSDDLRGTLVSSPSIAYIEHAFDASKSGGFADKPFCEITIPTLADPQLAPAGKHVMSLWLQYVPYRAKFQPDRVLEITLEHVSEFMPKLRSLVLHSQVLVPEDYQTRFHLSEGHLYGGDMTLAQTLFLRPIPGFADYRSPLQHLYLCGAGSHPGGGISGLSGRNCAHELMAKALAVPV